MSENKEIIFTEDNDLTEKDHAAIGIVISYITDIKYLKADFAKEIYKMGRDFALEAPEIIKVVQLTMKTRKRPCEPFSRTERKDFERLSNTEYFKELNATLDEIAGIKTFFAL